MMKPNPSLPTSAAGRGLSIVLLVAGLVACAGPAPASDPIDPQARAVLAPSGTLRVGVYLGSPTSMVRTASGETRGLSVEIGQALARRLGVPAEIAVFERVAGSAGPATRACRDRFGGVAAGSAGDAALRRDRRVRNQQGDPVRAR